MTKRSVPISFRKSIGTENADAKYDELIARFGDSADPSMFRRVSRARFNRARRLEGQEAVDAFASLVERFIADDDPELASLAYASMLNQGFKLSKLGDFGAATRVNDRVIAALDNATSDREAAVVTTAYFNRACYRARSGDIAGAIDGLAAWQERRGGFDREQVMTDDAFADIREHPLFVSFVNAPERDG